MVHRICCFNEFIVSSDLHLRNKIDSIGCHQLFLILIFTSVIDFMALFQTGLHKHFKGGEYLAIATALDSETQARFVIYTAANEENPEFWIRPLTMFSDSVTTVTGEKKRFTFLRSLHSKEQLMISERLHE